MKLPMLRFDWIRGLQHIISLSQLKLDVKQLCEGTRKRQVRNLLPPNLFGIMIFETRVTRMLETNFNF